MAARGGALYTCVRECLAFFRQPKLAKAVCCQPNGMVATWLGVRRRQEWLGGKGQRGWTMASGVRREAVLPGTWVRGVWRQGIGRANVGASAGGTDGRRGASASGPRGSHGGRARGVARQRRAAGALERRVPEHFGLTYFD
jgi:hypothetical protein